MPELSREEILAACEEMEMAAAELYRSFAGRARNPDLATLFRRMVTEEEKHAESVRRLVDWPLRPMGITRDDVDRARAQVAEVRRSAEPVNLPDEQMLALAAALELSEMDDLFGSVCRAAGIDPERGRAKHIGGLVEMATTLGGAGAALRTLLAAVIRLDRRSRLRNAVEGGADSN